jgi:hypothetical protein
MGGQSVFNETDAEIWRRCLQASARQIWSSGSAWRNISMRSSAGRRRSREERKVDDEVRS